MVEKYGWEFVYYAPEELNKRKSKRHLIQYLNIQVHMGSVNRLLGFILELNNWSLLRKNQEMSPFQWDYSFIKKGGNIYMSIEDWSLRVPEVVSGKRH